MKYTIDEKEKTIKIHTNVSTESLKTLLEKYNGYLVILEDETHNTQMITDSGWDLDEDSNLYDIKYASLNCCGGECRCKNNNEK